MKVVEIKNAFGLDHLAVGQRSRPQPGPGQVLLRMRAASLNHRDLMMVEGRYAPRQPLPLIPCSDGVGEVVELGPGVERVRPGDRVCPIFAQGWICGTPSRATMARTLGGPLDGTLAEYMAVEADGVVRTPEHLTDEEAASLPCATLTAWSALVDHGRVKAGDTVLVQGTGGVSIAALQLAGVLGARTIVTSSSEEKLDKARALGAWQTVNYRSCPDWARETKKLTDGAGVDLVVEVGGARTLQQSIHAVRPGGRICLIGVLSGRSSELDLAPILMRQVRVQGLFVGSRESFEALNRAIDLHRLRPAVSRIFPFDEARRAFEHLGGGGHFGKIAIRIA